MHTDAHRVTKRGRGVALLLLLTACGPTDESGITGIETVDDGDTTAPTVTSVTPPDGAVGVAVTAVLRVSFSESMSATSIGASTFTLSGGSTGSVGVSGQSATFEPDGELEYATAYTATVRGTVTDTAGNALGSDFTWSFTTEAAPPAPFSMSLAEGRRWLYEVEWSRTTVGSSIGVKQTGFAGRAVLVTEGETQWMGRPAWRLLRYDLEDVPGDHAFSREVLYVSEGPDGLFRWVANATGGEWRRVLSTQAASFSNNHFLMAGDPRGPTTTMSTAQVTVPAGSFPTVRAHVDYRVTGRYAPEDIFETRTEHYADGVGLVRGSWDFDFDDNDPSAFDVFEDGVIELTHADAGPFPTMGWDSEPNDGPGSGAEEIGATAIVDGSVAVTDDGTVVNSPDVHGNVNGQPMLQDWYRVSRGATGPVRIDLVYEGYRDGAWNDLDLYVFAEGAGGALSFVAAATAPQAEPEWLEGQLAAGTYYLVVQAWSTPAGPVEYALSYR